ncbi:unnamed protein product [Oikopleura dioica]|uniref:Uncharacterized protein n=1 Tax=Oikopleura dioica TaxID=34765 RepID=E4XVQ6_OIKDI|nr:unnamed protein product [Oikopleura dioica]
MGRGAPGYFDWKKGRNKRFWGYCTDSSCPHKGRFISIRRSNRRCPKCKGDKVEEELHASMNAKCRNDDCWASEKKEDKIQRFFPGADARCEHCHLVVFWVSRANGPGRPAGPYEREEPHLLGNYDRAYCGRAIAEPGDYGYGAGRRLADDFVANLDAILDE